MRWLMRARQTVCRARIANAALNRHFAYNWG
jgi:hypothetical protein